MYFLNRNRRNQSRTPSVFVFVLASWMATMALGFTPSPCRLSTTPARYATELCAATKSYPPMSREEIQAMLDTIPVYTVTEPNQEGLILLKEPNNPNDIAYFFFTPEAANTVFAPLQKKENEKSGQPKGDWSVSAYPLGLVWFELINDPNQKDQGVEYRLLPEPEDLIGAQNLLKEQQKQSKIQNPKINELFQAPFNQIPVFVDQFLRMTVPAKDGESSGEDREIVPMYISLKDLTETCKQAFDASSGEYQAAMSAIDLMDLIEEMGKENPNDYRQVVMVPPTPNAEGGGDAASGPQPVQQQQSPPEPDDALNWEGKQSFYGKSTQDAPDIITPTADNDLWA